MDRCLKKTTRDLAYHGSIVRLLCSCGEGSDGGGKIRRRGVHGGGSFKDGWTGHRHNWRATHLRISSSLPVRRDGVSVDIPLVCGWFPKEAITTSQYCTQQSHKSVCSSDCSRRYSCRRSLHRSRSEQASRQCSMQHRKDWTGM